MAADPLFCTQIRPPWRHVKTNYCFCWRSRCCRRCRTLTSIPNVLVMQTCFIILQVQVFQSFFVSLNLPYSVIRGEELALQVTVFNYEPKAQQVTVTLKGSKHWAIIDEVNKLGLRGQNPVNKDYVEKEMDLKVVVSVGAGQGRAISFPVVPRTLGLVPVEVRAQSTSHADAVKRNLLVEVGEQCVYAIRLVFYVALTTICVKEFKQRRFWVTHVNRKWSYCTLGPWFWTSLWANRLLKIVLKVTFFDSLCNVEFHSCRLECWDKLVMQCFLQVNRRYLTRALIFPNVQTRVYNQVTHGIFLQSIVWLVYICEFVSYSIQYNTITFFKEKDVITFNSFLTLRPSKGILQSALQLREVKEAVWRKFRQIQLLGMVHQTEWFRNPFSPKSDQDQFSLYNINIQWKEKGVRID